MARVRRRRPNLRNVFLASTWSNPSMRELRADISKMEIDGNPAVWVAEIDAPEMSKQNGYDPLSIVDRCLDEIEACKDFILIIDNDFSSQLSFSGNLSQSSYVEIELFQAVMHEKRIIVIRVGDIPKNSPIMKLLDVFMLFDSNDNCQANSYLDAISIVESIVYQNKKKFLTFQLGGSTHIRRLSGRFAINRHHDFANKFLYSEIEFLNGHPLITAEKSDLDVVEYLLDEASSQNHSNRKMSRTWLAIRTLMPHHYKTTSDPKILFLWERALRIWSKFAGWRGLHAHLWLGNIAALGSLNHVISKQDNPNNRILGVQHSDNVGGAFASVYYSLSKISPHKLSASFLSRSELYADHELQNIGKEFQSGLYAIKGSISLLKRSPNTAVEHFRVALELAEEHQHREHRIGELLAEIGWAELFKGQIKVGRSHIEEGVQMMEKANAEPGFIVRGKRKLTVARAITFDFLGVIHAAKSANKLVEKYGLYDQRRFPLNIIGKTKDSDQRVDE